MSKILRHPRTKTARSRCYSCAGPGLTPTDRSHGRGALVSILPQQSDRKSQRQDGAAPATRLQPRIAQEHLADTIPGRAS